MKIVINVGIGGFAISLRANSYMRKLGSTQAIEELTEYIDNHKGHWHGFGITVNHPKGYDRTDPLLVKAVEELGVKASYFPSVLKVVDVDVDDWYISEDDDGTEVVHETHKTWR